MRARSSILLASILAASPSSADDTKFPLYSYAVESGHFSRAGAIDGALYLRVPDSVWNCELAYDTRLDRLVAQCSAPAATGDVTVISRVSCASSDGDAETIHLSTLTPGKFASVYIGCRRDGIDDGF
jgi:hypothetical protein